VRVLLVKLSGEILGPTLRWSRLEEVAVLLREAAERAHLAVVVGGGNLIRGRSWRGNRVQADRMGMLATVLNGLALREALEAQGMSCEVMSAMEVEGLRRYRPEEAKQELSERLLVLVAGTGNPFLSTDTAAALRAAELGAELLVKATKVDGVYEDDPQRVPGARRLERLSYEEAFCRRLEVMDGAALSICRDQGIPILVVYWKDLPRALAGEPLGTIMGG